MDHVTHFKEPSLTAKADGKPRMVGFELEFSGLSLEKTAEAIQTSLGGVLKEETKAEKVIHVDSMGDFKVELDWDFLKKKATEDKTNNIETDWLEPLSAAASLVVPVEVVCPPVPITSLDSLDPVVTALRDSGAVGTEESLLAAYGVHINTEITKLDAQTICAHLRAFSLLQWWLVEEHAVNMSRKISPYIGLYPVNYVKQLLAVGSCINMETLCREYLEYNATRNRALDMLPMFAEIDADLIHRKIGDSKVNARSTFHYRLPNCNIERSDWSLAESWNNWWLIEELAYRKDQLDELSDAYLDAIKPLVGISRKNWVEFIDQWLKNHGLA